MVWFSLLLSSIAGGALLVCWLVCRAHCQCCHDRSVHSGGDVSKNSILISRAASECCSMLISLEDHKTQLYNRLAMLDEMIDKSDREIERLQEQLVRMNQLCSHPLNESGRDMLTLLRAGGFDEDDIQHLPLRGRDELEDAA